MSPYVHNIGRWADFLRGDSGWNDSVNAALDAIGLTKGYIVSIGQSRGSGGRFKAIKDSIWGMVEFEALDLALLDCPVVQRLRHIRQLGFSYLTYPGAQHSRFEHTVGVYHVACRILDAARRTREVLEKSQNGSSGPIVAYSYENVRAGKDALLIKHAALLHDIGHGAFSHASEDYFVDRQDKVNIGPFTIHDFFNHFRSYYRGVVPGTIPVVEARESKKLTEIVAVAIIISDRFVEFYSKLCHVSTADAASDLHKIGALILGDPIYDDDKALPEILSGPFDADKIDYMLRDANACGISLGIDVSRLFFRAGIYDVKNAAAFSAEAADDILTASLPCKLFLLDQSGVDAIREMGMGRLSLFSRVYHHQLTRNAEAHFQELLERLSARTQPENGFTTDFLKLWSLSDNAVQELVRRRSAIDLPDTDIVESTLWERQLLKRAACFTADFILGNDPNWPAALNIFSDAIERTRYLVLQQIHDRVGDPVKNRELIEAVKNECAFIKKELLDAGIAQASLPDSDRPSEIRLVGSPKKKEPTLAEALVLRPGRKVGKITPRFFSYYESGRIQEKRGYLFSPEAWRKIALLAFQRVLFREFLFEKHETVSFTPTIASEKYTVEGELQDGLVYQQKVLIRLCFRPILDIRSAAHESGLAWDAVQSLQHTIAHIYAELPLLIPSHGGVRPSNLDALGGFEGEGGWSIGKAVRDRPDDPLNAFLAQFPPGLRSDAAGLLGRVTVLRRDKLADAVLVAVSAATRNEQNRTVRLVPQSPSSGHLLRTFLQDRAQELRNKVIHASLGDALAAANDGDIICFVDDNIASGTQALRQLRLWLGQEAQVPPTSANYFLAPLTDPQLEKLNNTEIAFSFGVGSVKGCEALQEGGRALGLKCIGASFGRNLDEFSGKKGMAGEIPAELREFLRRVGIGVMADQTDPSDKDSTAYRDEIERKALGYDNLEGLIVTHFNVPTATYTALWSPGTYSPTGDPFSKEHRIPWRPLFIRAGKLRDVILF